MHYEGNEYPKNIEITDYRTYNLEARHPDAIYIHNSYDEWNYVTCVKERYFSKNLCRHTDSLVYITYFILGEIEPDDQKSIDTMKHFCFDPGVIYAHKVIVQSEKMLQNMMDVFQKVKEYQDEVALLWRPHPLISGAVKSMRPQLWIMYAALVEAYKQEGDDDTADMDRAVVLSDPSSVISVYKETGKPVMIQM